MEQAGNSLGTRARELAAALTSVIFPAPCRICGALLESASRLPLCGNCLAALAPYAGPICERCGRPIVSPVVNEGTAQALCIVCRRGLYDFEFARSSTLYSPAVTSAILLLKYDELPPLGRFFSRLLLDQARANPEEFSADVVVPVPLHADRLRERGHNQAELIARPLARALGLPCRSWLLRSKPRPDKLRLTLRERWRSVRGAYAIRSGARVDNQRVLLIDDVMTTGATLDACSRTLRQAGAARIVALTVARALPRGEAYVLEALARGPNR